ncbi:hypothetical protein [Aliiroseovarius sp. 2305UL8-7]|uniref:hypothetical protein n=1 Tax=Aliiroseovarius conchicola TaxID=3121637 RepID=UPI0035299A2A
MEFTVPAPLGAHASLLAQMPTRKPPDSSKVEAAPDAGKARAHMHNSNRHGTADDGEHISRADVDEDIRPDTLAGPPPTFQINVLEMEQKLQQQLALIEAERAQQNQPSLPKSDQPDNSEDADARPETAKHPTQTDLT